MNLKARFYNLAARAGRHRSVTGSVTLSSRRIYILPTGSGFFLAFIVGATLIGSLNYQSSLGFLFTFLLASVGLVSMVETQRNLTGIQIEVAEPKSVFAGEPLRIIVRVRGPEVGMRRGLNCFAHGGGTIRFSAGREPVDIAVDAPPRLRGVGEVGRVTLETAYPLGLFRAWSPVLSGARAVVYPAPHPKPGTPPTGGERGGGGGSQGDAKGNSVEDFFGLRDYLVTDSPSRVHWKSFARTGSLAVKEFEAFDPSYTHLDYDRLAPADPEERLSLLCAWVLAASNAGTEWSLALPGVEISRGSGLEHLRLTLQTLAAFDP